MVSREPLRYGTTWDGATDLQVELSLIASGGYVEVAGQRLGKGLFHHLMEARRLIWPDRYRHRWTDLMYREFIQNDVTILMGAASTQKTSTAVEYSILNYWASPYDTLVILSTVNMDKLDIGVYAELKMLWTEGRKRFPELAGHIVHHKRAITTDDIKEGERDFRRGVIARPCFPQGTLVDTPTGQIPIEKIKVGDSVINANGSGVVRCCMERTADRIVRVHFRDGRSFDCTPEHPCLTQLGWKKAIDLETSDWVLSPGEALQILREGSCRTVPKSEVLLRRMLQDQCGLPKLWQDCSQGEPWKTDGEILQLQLCNAVSEGQPDYPPKDLSSVQEGHVVSSESRVLFNPLPGLPAPYSVRALRESVLAKEKEKTNPFLQFVLRVELESSHKRTESAQIANPNGSRNGHLESVSRGLGVELSGSTEQVQKEDLHTSLVQDRHCISSNKTRSGTGRQTPPDNTHVESRQNAGQGTSGAWVDYVEILEPRSDPRYSESEGGYRVYNLEVEGHPSYSVNGFIVHNCYVGGRWVGLGVLAGTKQKRVFYVADELQFMAETFAAAWPHLFANGHVKIIGSGNPKHDPDDQLSIAAEPKDGWNAHPEPEKTEVWATKYMGGRCINLVGTDSPNFETPEGHVEPYKGLIGRSFAKRIAHDHGAGSFEYYRLIKGVMKVAFAHSRVITRQLCRDHHALEKAEWQNTQKTRVYGLDPSYGGEDRCVGMCLEFGESADKLQILKIFPYKVFQFDLRSTLEVEDQLANMLAEELAFYGIESTNVFYDANGKGTIGAAFARKFGSKSPVAVDSGDKPTSRPVRQDLFIDEDDGTKRLKRCDEHYSKFVTEMWFSVRYAIEADQIRELPEDVMVEGCARIYEMVAGNKIQVEPKHDPKKKDDLKRRLGKSPDLFDTLAIAVEGARQRGFTINRLGTVVTEEIDDDYFVKEANDYQKAMESQLLKHK